MFRSRDWLAAIYEGKEFAMKVLVIGAAGKSGRGAGK